jgi:hypothetical protein
LAAAILCNPHSTAMALIYRGIAEGMLLKKKVFLNFSNFLDFAADCKYNLSIPIIQWTYSQTETFSHPNQWRRES